ncbi:MAG: hypothetical protein Q9197_004476, partial [Variospora fuerteventurae]
MLREDWAAGIAAVHDHTQQLSFGQRPSGIPRPSKMSVLKKMKGAVTFIRARRSDEKVNNAQRPLIRHQNPRLNAPGVSPAPPLPSSRAVIAPAPIIQEGMSGIAAGEGFALFDRSRSGHRSSKQSSGDRRVELNSHTLATSAGEERAITTVRSLARSNATSTLAPTQGAQPTLIPRPLTAQTSTGALSPPARTLTTSPLPRIPHRRMHFLLRLGSGGEGHCDLFRLHSPPHTLLAVKTLKRSRSPSLVWAPGQNRRKPLEAYILQDLLPPHAHIIAFYDYISTALTTKFYTEYCPLGDLQDVLDSYFKREKKVPEGFLWHVFLQLAHAVAHLHIAARERQSGEHVTVLHRDIKPANVLLRPSSSSSRYPDLTLTDFGCSTHLPPLSASSSSSSFPPSANACVGTLTFQGPELPLQNTASDIWSVGATVHALAHGFPPMALRPRG